MMIKFLGRGFPKFHDYASAEREIWKTVSDQVELKFPNSKNLIISLTWFGPQFVDSAWYDLIDMQESNDYYDNVFLIALVDPPYLTVEDIHQIRIMTKALRLYTLGHFDGPGHFNFFSIPIARHFRKYEFKQLNLEYVKKVFVNYNRKPKPHRVKLVKEIMDAGLDKFGTITLGKDEQHIHDRDPDNQLYLSIGEQPEDYTRDASHSDKDKFGIPVDHYSLHRLDIWKETFLYVNAATEFDPVNDLFIQQDVFKPLIGLRPFVINGDQRTYRWLRANGFRTFNQYWSHIDIENGDVHDTIVELLHWLSKKADEELLNMYNEMLPDLEYNKQRFFEYAKEQEDLIQNIL